ncbi:MAG: hypothetical protein P8173_13365 [Gammaproteobacteria bacterium]|jgi:hypothetical protein
MTLPTDEKRQQLSSKTHYRSADKAKKADIVFRYHDADLLERHGYVPYWLKLVTVGLVIWGAYYMWAYWFPPST